MPSKKRIISVVASSELEAWLVRAQAAQPFRSVSSIINAACLGTLITRESPAATIPTSSDALLHQIASALGVSTETRTEEESKALAEIAFNYIQSNPIVKSRITPKVTISTPEQSEQLHRASEALREFHRKESQKK